MVDCDPLVANYQVVWHRMAKRQRNLRKRNFEAVGDEDDSSKSASDIAVPLRCP